MGTPLRPPSSRASRLLSSSALALVAIFTPLQAEAAPENGVVVGGSASISSSASTTTITQSTNRAIIRWDKFDVGASEHVDFQQPSSSSITVNRIGDTKASQIDGRITANGNIVLLNPNGVVFGQTAVVDVNGLVAATSDLEDDNAFMAGGPVKLTKPGNPDAQIIQKGTITVGQAGLAGFVAPHVENQGVIRAQLGKIALASGDIATIDFAGDGLIKLEVTDQVLKQQIRNGGIIFANGGQIMITAAAGRNVVESLIVNEGTISAPTVTGQKGTIRLIGSKSTVQNTGTITANGDMAEDGGQVEISAAFASLGGTISADGRNGGTIDVTAGTVSLADKISAQGLNGDGGTINIHSQTTWETSGSKVIVDAVRNGGLIRHIAEQQIITSGGYSANGLNGNGGQIDMSAWSTKLLNAQFSATGNLDGGTVRLGGEYQGGKDLPEDEIPNAYYLVMDRGTRIKVDSTGTDGKGGTAILWSDQETVALGTITATPGLNSGAGGFVEISSGETPKFDATIQTGRDDRAGTILLDPKNILITDFSFNSTAIILGYGYQGGRTNTSTNLDASDQFGYSISLSGNRVAVGAPTDDGFDNTMTDTGAVYLFSYTDSDFSGATLEGIIGYGYSGGKNIDMSPYLDNSDIFGSGLSLDGNRLAVGAQADDGAGNTSTSSGAVYLFSFADSTFSGGTMEGIIGRGYSGGKNYSPTNLTGGDYFGTSLSLDGNRLAVGAIYDDNLTNSVTNSGAVYLFTFTDSVFNGINLEAIIGDGYTGGKNINITLDNSDYFGVAVGLYGDQLAIGAERDDGFGNTQTDTGAVYLFSFSDLAFSGGSLKSTMGYGYTGGNNVNLALDNSDWFGGGIGLDNNRLVVGARADDGFSNNQNAIGAVYLFTHNNSNFDGLTLQSQIGYQYTDRAKDLNLQGLGIGNGDYFGTSISLDGNRLVVGAIGDDGASVSVSSAGNFYAFTFADSQFSTPNLEGITGSGYTQGRNYNVPGLADYDTGIGYSVALDGRQLAIGNYRDDGFGSRRADSGAVYLYSFSDDNFSNGTLEAIVGNGYTGGKNYNQSLSANDQFGFGLSLDGNRLAVGAPNTNILSSTTSGAGAVYLYSFADSVFNGITLQSTFGYGYTGGKNYDTSTYVGGNDFFGMALSLDGNRLAVGAYGDDGNGNILTNAGAVYLFSFADSLFSTPTLQSIIGRGYTGGKNLDVTALDANDNFGFTVFLDGTRLAVGAYGDDGFGNTGNSTGKVYLYNFTDLAFSGGTLGSVIGNGYTGANNINLALNNSDNFGISVALSGNHVFVGANNDDGYLNGVSDSGAVYHFQYANSTLTSGGSLVGTYGARYSGTNDYDLRGYAFNSDSFGRSLDISGTNLVIGASQDDGYNNNSNDAGAIYLIQFSDLTYQTANLMGIIGADYGLSALAKSINMNTLNTSDQFGAGVSLDGNRLAVGALGDDGFNDSLANSGAVYLYTFTDSAFSGGKLEAIIGSGYTGGKNVNMTLDGSDFFGNSVSLDGNRLAVGAYQDDGSGNSRTNGGAVYLYTFTDAAFSGGALAATIGHGYTGGKNISASRDTNDYFGWSVSLDGNRLAVGSQRDDGSANNRTDSGAVYLYTFTDSVFSGGTLAATIGYGYTGGKNINAALDNSDWFGNGVSLDGNMLAIGAAQDDGFGNALTNSGAVYLYTFTDSVFSGGVLQGTAGYGYTGGKNINVTTLETGDTFGANVSLNSNRLAVGIEQDDGYDNQALDSGAVQLYSFSDSTFSGGTLQSTIGYKYTGGKNVDLSQAFISDPSDYFNVVSLDANRLVIGGYRDDASNGLTDSGTVVMMTFSDAAFSTGTVQGLIGNGSFGGGKSLSVNPSLYSYLDQFGTSMALNANRLVIGTIYDDGYNDSLVNSGAVYLYSIPGGDYDAITFEGIMGVGYTGGKNVDLSAYLDRQDQFGYSVALDGNRLAVGANFGDGRSNNVSAAGDVYLFTFADSVFNGATLQARIGDGYTGTKDINIPLGSTEYFGGSLSLDGNRLAVGAQRDDGFGNIATDSGAVYLFTFSDGAFSGGTLQSTIGYGYTGGNNLDLSAYMNNSDNFGTSVSLDGNRLVVGAPNDDGNGNTGSNTGAVYLISFADSSFSTPTFEGIMGLGYTGGKNYDVSTLATSDTYGSAVVLDGTILAVGASGDQGFASDAGARYGAIFLYTFGDTAFNNALYDSAIGQNYIGGKNIPFAIGGGVGNNISMDGGVLITSIPSGSDVTGAYIGTGRVYIFRDSLSHISTATSFNSLPGNTIGITAASLASLLSTPQNVILQASNDITLASPLFVNNGSGNGGTLTLQAGRSILINAALDTDNGDLNLYANENLSEGVLNAQRDAGAATISMGAAGSINAGTGNVMFRMDTGAGKTNFLAGNIDLRNVTANTITAHSLAQTGDIITRGVLTGTGAGTSILLAAGANYQNPYGAGSLVTPSGRYLIYTDHSNYTDINGLTPDFTQYKCTYTGPCTPAVPGTGNGLLYEYGLHLLTVTANISRAYGDANPTVAQMQSQYTYTGFEGSDNAGVLDVLPTATIIGSANSSSNAGNTFAITLSGGSDNYYDYYFIDGLLTITKKDVTATWNAPLSKTYGDLNPTVNTTNFTYTGLANGQNNGVITAVADFGTVDQTTGAGTYNVGATFSATNYNVISSPVTTLTINKRNITAAWTGALTRTYGDANPAVTTSNFNYAGFVNGDTNSAVTATGNYGAITTSTDVGAYVVGANFTSANYNITNAPTTGLTITKRNITASVNNASRAYGDANPAWTWADVVFTNLANGENGSVLDALTVSAPTAIGTSNAGTTHNINLTGFSDNNYNLTSSTSGTLTITKRDITASVNNASRAYGDANPAWTWADVVFTNLANGENGSVLDALTVSAPTAIGTSNAGTTHNINLTGFSDNNYNLTGASSGTLTINKRNITATVGAHTQTYGESTPTITKNDITWNNLANGETGAVMDTVIVTSPTLSATSTTGSAHTANIGTFADNNYNLTGFTAGTSTITKAPLTLRANNATSITGSALPTFTYTLTGLKNGELPSVLTGVTMSSTALPGASVGTYNITGAGGTATNYYVATYLAGTLTITPVVQTQVLPPTVEYAITPQTNTPTGLLSPSSLQQPGSTSSSSSTPSADSANGDDQPQQSEDGRIVFVSDNQTNWKNSPFGTLIAVTESIKRFFGM